MALYDQTQTPQHSGGFTDLGGRWGASGGLGVEARASGLLKDFSPFGTERLRNLIRRRALNNARSQRRQTSLMGGLYGLDPQQQNYSRVLGEQGANQGVADTLNNAELANQRGGQDFLQQLFMGQLDRAAQQRIARMQQRSQSGANAGSIAGAAIGVLPKFLGLP